jgi:hypothetical protein
MIRGMPRIASDHRPVAMGAARASTPSAINRAPATRFPKIPEGCGMSHSLAVKAIQEGEATITVYQLYEVIE